MKPDDCTLTPDGLHSIRKMAQQSLERSDAFGRYPTPVPDIMECAKLSVAKENVLDTSFLKTLRKKFGSNLKRAISKILGLLDVNENLIYIDKTLLAVKQTFLKLHETAHAVLPWQSGIYSGIEDCQKTLASEISDLFDREANVFASEVLFQLDDFTKRAESEMFCIRVPIKLSKRYGASVYSSIRRYVSENHRTCVVIVTNPPEFKFDDGYAASLRRVIPSPKFKEIFGDICWPETVTPDDEIGAMIPLGSKKMSSPRSCSLTDSNGVLHECIAEAFKTPYQAFILIHVVKALTGSTIVFPTCAADFNKKES